MARKPAVRIVGWKIETRHNNGGVVELYLTGTALNHPRMTGPMKVRTSNIKRIYRTDVKYTLRAETHNTIYVLEGWDKRGEDV